MYQVTDKWVRNSGLKQYHLFPCVFQVMELETAVQVSTNQMKRQEEENKRLQEALDAAEANIRTMQSQMADSKRKCDDLASQVGEEMTKTKKKRLLFSFTKPLASGIHG